MKILHLISQTPDFTGSGTFVRALIRQGRQMGHENYLLAGAPADFELPESAARQHKVEFVRFDGVDLGFPIPGMSDIMPYASSRFSQLDPSRLSEYIKVFTEKIQGAIQRFKPDLIHSHHLWIATAMAGRVAGNIPLVTTCHGTCLRQHHLCPHISEMITPDLHQINHVIALSHGQKKLIQDTVGIEPNKISILSGGYDQDVFNFKPKSFSGTVYLVYAGKISSPKGVPWLLKSLIRIKDLPFELHMAGNASEGEKAHCLSLAEQLGEKAVYHGMLSQKELAEQMQKAHVFVLPSFYEGLPLVLMEALACGCRIITTALPGVYEIFREPPPQMVRMLELPKLETIDRPYKKDEPQMEKNLAAILKQSILNVMAEPQPDMAYIDSTAGDFTWEKIFSKTEKIYHQLR